MKRYSIYELKVIKVENNTSQYSFICKYNGLRGTYVEIFTGEEIKADDKNITTLSEYYPPLVRQNYKTGQPLMIDKKEILRKYIDINSENYLQQNEFDNEDEESLSLSRTLLEKAIRNFFPKEGVWYSSCFRRPDELRMSNLPCHLRDYEWLAKMLKENQNLFFMSHNKILNFIKSSSLFQEERHKYEQEIVRWQIEWIVSGGEGWICDDEYGGDFVFLTPCCDLGVRKGVVDTLKKIGMDEEAIEEGIEKNKDLWMNRMMERAFYNEYGIPFVLTNGYGNNNQVPQPEKEHKEKWLKMRKYEYYQRHKDSVDKYGSVEPEMLMKDEEVEKLKAYLEEKHAERKKLIEELKARRLNPQSQISELNKIKVYK